MEPEGPLQCSQEPPHWSLSWARPIQSTPPHPNSLRSILIISTHQRLGLLSGLFPSGFRTRPCMYSSSPRKFYKHFQFHLPWLDHSNYIWPRLRVMKLLITRFSPTFYHFIPLRSKYSPQHLFSNDLSSCSSLTARDQASYSYKTSGKIIAFIF
jgi:hypothetical protein